MKAPVIEERVPFELGKKRGKVYVPTYNAAELEAIRKTEAVAEAVRLDDDEEAALGQVIITIGYLHFPQEFYFTGDNK